MAFRVTVTLLDKYTETHDYVETVRSNDGYIAMQTGRDKWVHYSLTSIIKWETEVR